MNDKDITTNSIDYNTILETIKQSEMFSEMASGEIISAFIEDTDLTASIEKLAKDLERKLND